AWLAVLGTLIVTATSATPAAMAEPEPRGSGPQLVFADEFDAPAGTPVDTGKGNMEIGDNPNNAERQYYTDSTANAVHDGQGNLVITARKENPADYQCWYGRCEYTSARLHSAGKFSQAYWRVESRVKVPRPLCVWPWVCLLGVALGNVGWPGCG